MAAPFAIDGWQALGAGAYGQVLAATAHSRRLGKSLRVAIKWMRVAAPPSTRSPPSRTSDDDDAMVISEEEDVEDDGQTTYQEAVDEFVIGAMLAQCNAPSFPRVYGAFLVKFTPATPRRDFPFALHALTKPADRSHYAIGIVSELGEDANLSQFKKRGKVLSLLDATALFFDLTWSFMMAHTQVAVLYHGDFQAANVVLKARTNRSTFALFAAHRPGYRTSDRVGAWAHQCPLRPLIIDYGFTRYLVLGRVGPLPAAAAQSLALHRAPELYFGKSRERDSRSDVWQLALVGFTLFAAMPRAVTQLLQEYATTAPDLLKALERSYSDSLDLPLAYATILSMTASLPAVINNETDENAMDLGYSPQEQALREQAGLGKRFVNLLITHTGLKLSRGERENLNNETTNSHMYARFINIAMLQEALGNGWRPSREEATAAGFTNNGFYQSLYDPVVARFFLRFVLPSDSLLMATMREMVNSLRPDVQDLLRRMLRWNPSDRTTCQEALLDPLFRRQLGQQAEGLSAPYTHSAHIRSPVVETSFKQPVASDSAMDARMNEIRRAWILHEQTRLRNLLTTGKAAETYADIVDAIGNSVEKAL
jgi:serine/threonine protein kinase